MATRRTKKQDHLQLTVSVFTEVLVELAVEGGLLHAGEKITGLLQSLPDAERESARSTLQMMIGRINSSVSRLAQFVNEA